MRRTRVKICGVTRAEDAALAATLGADAVGVVFAVSPRQVTPEQARLVLDAAGGFVSRVGVFADQELSWIRDVAAHCRLDWVQLCGGEPPEFARAVSARVVRVIHVRDEADITAAQDYPADAFALDAAPRGHQMGGTGHTFDWNAAACLPWPRHRVVVAGGLTAENVGDVIARLMPGCVDVSSGVEAEPGVKDAARIDAFIAGVQRADAQLRPLTAPRPD